MDRPEKCTLTDSELIQLSRGMLSELAKTGGRSWTMRVPVDFNRDHDMILCELISRFEMLTQAKVE